MSKKKKIIISLLIIFILGIVYALKQKYDSVLKATAEGLVLGETYGKIINQTNCIFGLKMKYANCTTMECELSANGYIKGCIETAEKDDFCNNVPNIKDTKKAIDWVFKTCTENKLNNNKCLKYMHKFVSVCTEQSEKRKLSTGEIFESGFKKGYEKSLK